MKPIKIEVKKAEKQNWWSPARWVVTKTYRVILDDGTVLEIHVGFEFETSIPRIFWPLLSPTGTLFEAGGVHDFGYIYDPGGRGKDYWDLVLFQIAEREQHRKYAHPTAHKMVSLLGHKAWEGHRERDLKIPEGVRNDMVEMD